MHRAPVILPGPHQRLQQGALPGPGDTNGKRQPALGAELINDRALRQAVRCLKIDLRERRDRVFNGLTPLNSE